jgi:hypothetical protein
MKPERIELPDERYLLNDAGDGAWTLYGPRGRICGLTARECEYVDAAYKPHLETETLRDMSQRMRNVIVGQTASLKAYEAHTDGQLDKLLAISREAACNPRYGKGFVVGLQAAHALLSGSGDLDALALRAANAERQTWPWGESVVSCMLGTLIGLSVAFWMHGG